MRLFAVLFCCGAALAQERAFVEVTAEKEQYYVGERMELNLRFGYDRDFFEMNAVKLFAREMEVPVQVQAQMPGLHSVAHLLGPTFGLNDGVLKANLGAEETRDGRVFAIVESIFDYTRSESGELTIAAPTLRYAYATEFDEDFVTGRVAKDPRQEVVAGAPLTLRILPLPEEGRPPEFKDAVGRFTVSAEASRTSLAVGETLVLKLKIKGNGNVSGPDLQLPGFHLLGIIHKDVVGYVADYHLKLLSADVKEIPAIPFAFFDPGPPAGYRVVRTDPIPIEVRGPAAADPPAPPTARPDDGTPITAFVVAALVVAASAALVLWRRARRRVTPPDPDAVRVREALATLRRRVASPGTELADALTEFLAAYLDCPSSAVIGPDLPARLVSAGLASDLASRAAATVERLVAARYGGDVISDAAVSELVADLHTLLQTHSPSPPR